MFNVVDPLSESQESQISDGSVTDHVKDKCNTSVPVAVVREHENMVGLFTRETGDSELLQIHLQVDGYVAVKGVIESGWIATVYFPLDDSPCCISHLCLGRQ